MSKKLIPDVRFEGFINEWTELSIYEFAKLSQGLQIAIDKRFTTPGKTREFYLTNEFLNPNSKTRYYIESPPANVTANKDNILMTRTGNTGKVVTDVEGAFHNNFFNIDYDRRIIEKYFLYYTLITSNVQRDVLSRAGSSTIPDLNHTEFYKINVRIPNYKEQESISEIMLEMEKKISNKNIQISKLNQFKKAMLQKMFPKNGQKKPEVRFEGFEGGWSTKKIMDLIVKGGSGGTPVSTESEYYGGDIPFLSITDITNSKHLVTNTEKSLTVKGLKNSTAYIVPKGSVSLAMYASVGKVAVLGIDAATSQAFYNMEFDSSDLSMYVYIYLSKVKEEKGWEQMISTGTQSNLNADKVKNYELLVPSQEELTEISRYFTKLNQLIELEELELKKIQQFKKAMLQKMFV